MERQRGLTVITKFHYSEVKPIVTFARKYWSNPNEHTPWQGYEDLKIDKKGQLKAVRRQVLDTGKFFMTKGQTPTTIVPFLEEMLLEKSSSSK